MLKCNVELNLKQFTKKSKIFDFFTQAKNKEKQKDNNKRNRTEINKEKDLNVYRLQFFQTTHIFHISNKKIYKQIPRFHDGRKLTAFVFLILRN